MRVYAAEDIPGAADGVSLKKDTLVELIRIESRWKRRYGKGLAAGRQLLCKRA